MAGRSDFEPQIEAWFNRAKRNEIERRYPVHAISMTVFRPKFDPNWSCERNINKTQARRFCHLTCGFVGRGTRIRTWDLRVMSPTSYQTAPSRIIFRLRTIPGFAADAHSSIAKSRWQGFFRVKIHASGSHALRQHGENTGSKCTKISIMRLSSLRIICNSTQDAARRHGNGANCANSPHYSAIV